MKDAAMYNKGKAKMNKVILNKACLVLAALVN